MKLIAGEDCTPLEKRINATGVEKKLKLMLENRIVFHWAAELLEQALPLHAHSFVFDKWSLLAGVCERGGEGRTAEWQAQLAAFSSRLAVFLPNRNPLHSTPNSQTADQREREQESSIYCKTTEDDLLTGTDWTKSK